MVKKHLQNCKKKTLALILIAGLGLGNSIFATEVKDVAGKKTEPTVDITKETVPGRDLSGEIKVKKNELAIKRQELAELKKNSQALQHELEELELDKEDVQKEKENILKQLKYAQETLEKRVSEQNQAHASLLAKQEQYQQRLAAMFYYKQRSLLETLLSSKGLDGFFSNIRMIATIAESDARMIQELHHAEEVAKVASELAEVTAEEFKKFVEEKEKQLAELQQGIVDKLSSSQQLSVVLQQRGTEEQNLAKTLAEQEAAQAVYIANSEALKIKIAKMEQKKRAEAQARAEEKAKAAAAKKTDKDSEQNQDKGDENGFSLDNIFKNSETKPGDSSIGININSGSYLGKAVWPLPGFYELWSPYGWRDSSFDAGNGYLHTGADISGQNAAGTPVVAAWSGIVVSANAPAQGQMYAPNANYVQINHGNGLGSGYWHLLDVTVSVGQSVQAGEVIGHCGSTGMSTGPHLHFEVYDKNNPNRALRDTVDPMPYLK